MITHDDNNKITITNEVHYIYELLTQAGPILKMRRYTTIMIQLVTLSSEHLKIAKVNLLITSEFLSFTI